MRMRNIMGASLVAGAMSLCGARDASASLPTPQLLTPVDDAFLTMQSSGVVLSWGTTPGATHYRLFLATSQNTLEQLSDADTTCAACQVNVPMIDNQFTLMPQSIEPNKTYYWMVRAGAPGDASPNSPIRSFRMTEWPLLATGFIYPVLGPSTSNPTLNVDDPIVGFSDSQCTSGSGYWNVNQNDFGNEACDASASIGCPASSCYHPGEDWNRCGGNDTGKPVHAVANGKVVESGKLSDAWGYYITIEHLLPSSHTVIPYLNSGWSVTMPSETFDTVYSTYLHIHDPQLADGTVVKKGDVLGAIYPSPGPHLHFEMKTQLTLNSATNCECGYCESPQDLVDERHVEPDLFIAAHAGDAHFAPKKDPTSGQTVITGNPGLFGTSQGTGRVEVSGDTQTASLAFDAQVTFWSDTQIEINLFSFSSLSEAQDFTSPLKVTVVRDDGKRAGTLHYPFHDVRPEQWFAKSVVKLWKNQIVQGRMANSSSNYFFPEAPVTRAELLKMAVKASGHYCVFCWEPTYADLSDAVWAKEDIKVAFNRGWIDAPDPVKQNKLYPNALVTRAEAAKIMARALELQNKPPPASVPFEDVKDSSAWFYSSVYHLKDQHVMKGYASKDCNGTPAPGKVYFCPEKTINRAEAAKMICEAFYRGECS